MREAAINLEEDPGCVIVNGTVVSPDGLLENASVVVKGGRIAAVGTGGLSKEQAVVDATGLLILPGFVDLHSDAVESEIQPRPGGRFPVEMALIELDKRLAACGITTMFHSLSFSATDKNEMRRAEVARSVVLDIHALAGRLTVRNLIHGRYEIIDAECAPLMEALIREGRIHLFSIMDHTPGQGQFVSMDHFKAYYGTVDHMTAEELEDLAERRLEARRSLDMVHVDHLATLCRKCGVPMASHDDDSAEKVSWLRDLGIRFCEFPVNAEAAQSASRLGLHVLMGAPNVLRGESLTGNLSGREAVRRGWCDIIASDYAPASMLHAVFELHRLEVAPLHALVNMVSLNPARAVGLDGRIGAVRAGMSADLVLVDAAEEVPRIRATFVEGRLAFSTFTSSTGFMEHA